MQYIVMDLEWNNVYSIKRGGFMNEVMKSAPSVWTSSFVKSTRFPI